MVHGMIYTPLGFPLLEGTAVRREQYFAYHDEASGEIYECYECVCTEKPLPETMWYLTQDSYADGVSRAIVPARGMGLFDPCFWWQEGSGGGWHMIQLVTWGIRALRGNEKELRLAVHDGRVPLVRPGERWATL